MSGTTPSAPRLPGMIRKVLDSRLAALRAAKSTGERLSMGCELLASVLEAVEELQTVELEVKAALLLDTRPDDDAPAPEALLAAIPPARAKGRRPR